MKAYFMVYETQNQCKLVKGNVRNGRVIIDNGIYVVDEANPILLQAGMFKRIYPLYEIKWDSALPSNPSSSGNPKLKVGEAKRMNLGKANPPNPEFPESGDLTPEMLKRFADLSIMSNLLGGKRSSFQPIMMMMIGMGLGAIVFFALQYFHII